MNIILCDTREKKNKSILNYFDKNGIDYIITKLDAGDYTLFKNFSKGVVQMIKIALLSEFTP